MARTKDRPLLLRRRQDGKLYLNGPWPPRHEFSQDWLLENTKDGVVSMDDKEIHVKLANASAVYRIERSRMEQTHEDGTVHRLSTGYWGKLTSSKGGQ